MDSLRQDLRFALRSLMRRPLFASLAVVTLGLGIGSGTAMFSVVDAVLLQPLPYPEPDRLASIYSSNPSMRGHPTMGGAAERGRFSYPEFEDLYRPGPDAFEAMALLQTGGSALLTGEGPARQVRAGATTPGLFSRVLEVEPVLGRTFTEEDARAGASVVLLSDGFWRRRFGADPTLVGQTIQLDSEPVTVIGVLPDEDAPFDRDLDVWRLLQSSSNRESHSAFALGRLRHGVTPEQATAALTATMTAADAAIGHGHGVNVFSLHRDTIRDVRGVVVLLSLSSLVLLLVACGNVAALLVGSAIDRDRELGVRVALGARRGRLIRQLLTESVALAATGAILGVAVALAATEGLLLLAPPDVPRIHEATIDPRALLVAIGLALSCGLLFGLAPALGVTGTDGRSSIVGRASRRRSMLQPLVVAGELAMATVLLVGAGLLVRTSWSLSAVETGYASGELLHVEVDGPVRPPGREPGADGRSEEPLRSIEAALEALPGVRGVASTSHVPLSGARASNWVRPEGYDGDQEIFAERRLVSAGYFEVAGIRILQGRGFTEDDDRPDAPDPAAMVISEGMARTAWPGASPLGKRLRYLGDREGIVVGVAATLRDESLITATDFAYYVPLRKLGQNEGSMLVRTDRDPASLVPAVRQRIRDIDGNMAVPVLVPLTDHVQRQLSPQVYRARLMMVFAGLAGLFSLMGIYGVTTRDVASRTRELGIRMALGSDRAGVTRLVLLKALRLAILGGAVGLAASFVTTRFLERFLWGIEPTDPPTILGTVVILVAFSLVAAMVPGRRAARVDPAEAFRTG